jgi:signal transduction histidine kinase
MTQDEAPDLRGLLGLLDEGVSVFDAELRLSAWNRRFVELLRLPPEMVTAGLPFAALVRHLGERGELGPYGNLDAVVAQRVEAARRCVRSYAERTTLDGRVLAAQTQPLPQGGFAIVYSDVTQRSAAELFTPERSEELERRVNQRTVELRAVNEELHRKMRELAEASAARQRSERAAEQARHEAQKMSAIGQLAGGLAHDFNNLLTVILGNLRSLEERLEPRLVAELVAPALRAGVRGADITRRLLAFARQQTLEPIAVDVRALITGTAQLLHRSLPASITLRCAVEEQDGWPALVDPCQLENALVNLALNARDAMPDGGMLTMSTRYERRAAADGLPAGDYVRIDVADTGTGMSPEVQARIFEPFFTTKPFGSGSGLGLSMVFGFVRQSGGDIAVESEVGRGTTITLRLPRAEGAVAAPVEHPEVVPPGAGAGKLVLLVEDQEDVRQTLRRQLLELGYRVLEARDGDDAHALLSAVPEVAALVSDVVMPGATNGVGLADRARRLVPGIKIVLITGFAGPPPAGYDWFDEKRVLRKPFGKDALARALEAEW